MSNEVKRLPNCPQCGGGVFVVENHPDRVTCDTCGLATTWAGVVQLAEQAARARAWEHPSSIAAWFRDDRQLAREREKGGLT